MRKKKKWGRCLFSVEDKRRGQVKIEKKKGEAGKSGQLKEKKKRKEGGLFKSMENYLSGVV